MKNKRIFLQEFYRSGELEEGIFGLNIRSTTQLDKIKTQLLNIILHTNNIGEKSFKATDNAKVAFDSWCLNNQKELEKIVNSFKSKNLRDEFCAEYCYYKFFNNKPLDVSEVKSLTEKKKSEFEILEKNKIPLTPEEREEVIKSKATWNHGQNGEPSPAVWKGKNSKDEIIYVTNTHRAYNTAKTLKGAISRFHKFIKSTA